MKSQETKEINRWQRARDCDRKHQETLQRKYDRLDGLKALLKELDRPIIGQDGRLSLP